MFLKEVSWWLISSRYLCSPWATNPNDTLLETKVSSCPFSVASCRGCLCVAFLQSSCFHLPPLNACTFFASMIFYVRLSCLSSRFFFDKTTTIPTLMSSEAAPFHRGLTTAEGCCEGLPKCWQVQELLVSCLDMFGPEWLQPLHMRYCLHCKTRQGYTVLQCILEWILYNTMNLLPITSN